MAPSWNTELTSPSVAICRRKTTTLMPSNPIETAPARIEIAPPVIVRGARTDLRPSAMHSGHWNPTEASRMQSGQMSRSHRWQLMYASRSACR